MSYESDFLNKLAASSPGWAYRINSLAEAGLSEDEIIVEVNKTIAEQQAIIASGMSGVVTTVGDEAETTTGAALGQVKTANPEIYKAPEAPSETDEVAEVVKGRQIFTGITNIVADTIVAAAVIKGLIPFVDNPDGILAGFAVPQLRAAMTVAVQTMNAEHDFCFMPMMQRYYLRGRTPLIPEAYRLVDMVTKRQISDEEFDKAMAENGLSKTWSDAYRGANYTGLPLEVALALVRRGAITDEDYRWNMRIQSYDEQNIWQSQALFNVIPPLTDLINMAVKEGLGTHTSEEQYGLLVEWASKMGLTKEWVEAYWYAHWERIPLSQMYDNLYRGNWDKDKFIAMLRIKDLHPEDREAIFNVAYQIPSVRELGYGYDVGLYVRDDIAKFRRYGGLSSEDAEKAADALILYRNEAEKNAVLTEYMYLYGMGKITEEEFKAKFTEKGIPESTYDLWLERAKAYTIRISKPTALEEGRIISSSEAIWAYKNLNVGADWLRVHLSDVDWADDRIELEIKRADKEIADAVPVVKPVELTLANLADAEYWYRYVDHNEADFRERLRLLGWEQGKINIAFARLSREIADAEAPKALTESQWKGMYDAGVIDKEGLQKAYMSFGYPETEASLLAMWAAVSIRFGDLVNLYKNGWIDAQAVYDELITLELPAARATELMQTVIKYQQPTRVAAEKDLTKAEIIKGWKSGILDDTQAVELLVDLGYSEDEAMYLLQINAVVAKADPESYWEMKKVTESYKKALGQKSKPIPDDLLIMEARYKQLKKELADLKASGAGDVEVSAKVIQVADVEANYRKMMVEWEKSAV